MTTLNENEIRRYYDNVYHKDVSIMRGSSLHFRRLVKRLGPWKGKQLLDVGVVADNGSWRLLSWAQIL